MYIGKVNIGSTDYLIGSTLYGTCDTDAATAAKVVTMSDFDTLLTGVTIHVKFRSSNTVANPTLNVNDTGAKSIKRYGTTGPSTSSRTSWNAGSVISFTYDGTYWLMNDWSSDTTYTGYDILFKNNDGGTLDTYKPLTSPSKTFQAGDNITMTAASNVITIKATDTTYSIGTGDSNGQIKVTPSSGSAYNVSVKGLGSRAYDSTSYLPLAGGTMSLGEGLKFHSDNNYFGTNADARIISLIDGNGNTCDGGLIIDERATNGSTTTVTELLRIRHDEFKWKGNNILHSGNYSSYALPLSGGTMDGTSPIVFTTNNIAINFRTGHSSYDSKVLYMASGNEALVFSNKNPITSYIFKCGYALENGSNWNTIFTSSDADNPNVPTIQLKNQSLYVNEFIPNGTTPSYNFYVNGSSKFNGTLDVTDTTTADKLVISNTSDEEHLGFSRGSYNYVRARTSGGSINFIVNGKAVGASNVDLAIASNGNVGIGTYQPAQKLDVNGYLRLAGGILMPRSGGSLQFYLNDTDKYVIAMRVFTDSDTLALGYETSLKSFNTLIYGNAIEMYYKNSSGSLNLGLTIKTSGYVGIGKSSPLHKLDVDGDVGATDLFIGEHRLTTTSNYLTVACKSNEMVLVGDASTMYINYRGFTGKTSINSYKWNAGSSSTWAKHEVGEFTARGVTNIYPTGDTSSVGVLIGFSSTFTGPEIILDPSCTDSVIGTGSDYTTIAVNKANSNAYITYAKTHYLYVSPRDLSNPGYFNANGAWVAPSDISLKKDIYKPAKDKLHEVWEWLVLKGFKNFTWKDTDKEDFGVIAQEVLEAVPNAVDYDESKELYGVDYTKLHSHVIASIVQELKDTKEEIKQLQALIAELKLLLNN